jgi:hypothetical protein
MRAKITLVSDSDRFLCKPNSIYVPFGMDPEKLIDRVWETHPAEHRP